MRSSEGLEIHRRSWREWGIGPVAARHNEALRGQTTGQFIIPGPSPAWDLFCLAHDGRTETGELEAVAWEHVSVTARLKHGGYKKARVPTYDEMRITKMLFWHPHEVVMELHVAESDHVNITDTVLHLWRPLRETIPTPPLFFV